MALWMTHVSGLLLLLFVTSGTGQNSTTSPPTATPTKHSNIITFDCRRGENTCNNGTCNLSTGKCDCHEPESSNYACLPNGMSGSCEEGFYGADCSINRAQVFCIGDAMFVNINPMDGFAGVIYVQGDPKCKFENDTNISPFQEVPELDGWSHIFSSNDTTCQANSSVSSLDNSLTSKIYIQYSTLFKTSVDQIVTATCIFSNNATVGSNLTEVDDNDGTNIDHVDTGGKAEIVTLKILKQDGSPVTGSVQLGQEIHLVFTMKVSSSSVYTDFRLLECKANNTMAAPADYKDIVILRDGCPQNEAKSVFSGLPEKDASKPEKVVVDVSLKAFMFVGSSFVAFECNIAFCGKTTDPTSCQDKDCPGFSKASDQTVPPTNSATTVPPTDSAPTVPSNDSIQIVPGSINSEPLADLNGTTSGHARRKRSGDNGETKVVKLKVVDSPENNTAEVTGQGVATNDCDSYPDYIPIVAILGACVFLLLLVTVFLSFRLVTSKKKDQSPRPVESLRFPRLELNSSHNNSI